MLSVYYAPHILRGLMTRRSFAQIFATCFSAAIVTRCASKDAIEEMIMTVNGPVSAKDLGMVLSHEHILVDFAGAEIASMPDRYNPVEVFNTVLPYLRQIKQLGCKTFFDFTPAYLGREARLLKRLSDATGLHIITNTGYYGARGGEHLPVYAIDESADELAARWIGEFESGIGDTGIKPGFVKIGVEAGPLSEIDVKLVRAGARTHLATGLTVATHTGPAEGALEQLTILKEEGVHPSAWIWVHAQAEQDMSRHIEVARQGAWVAFDGIGERHLDRDVALLKHMKDNELLEHVLLSQDAGWYSVGEENGGGFRDYSYLITGFLPELEKAGFTDEEIELLTVDNPARAFTISIRPA